MRAAPMVLCLLASLPAGARPALRPFPAETVLRYADTLRHGEIAVVETDAGGRARQITNFGHSEAPPALCRALVADPALYPRYVRNLTRSEVERRPDGTLLNRWRLSYPIGSFSGTDEVRLLPAATGAAGAVEVRSLGEGQQGTFRWDFLPAPGGGTVVVSAGYYDPLDNAFLRVLIGDDPALEAGFNLAGGLSLLRALTGEATREARAAGQAPVRTEAAAVKSSPDLGPLLDRGTVALVRTEGGRLVDVAVVARVAAAPGPVRDLLRDPGRMPRMLRSRVSVLQRDAAGVDFEMAVSSLLFDVVTGFRLVFTPGGADTLGVGGALRGARFRWDVGPDSAGGSDVVWRGNLHIGEAGGLMRTMLRIEPSFEHSANVSMGLIAVRALTREVTGTCRSRCASARCPSQSRPAGR